MVIRFDKIYAVQRSKSRDHGDTRESRKRRENGKVFVLLALLTSMYDVLRRRKVVFLFEVLHDLGHTALVDALEIVEVPVYW